MNDSSYLLNFKNFNKSLKNFKLNFISDFHIYSKNIFNFSDQILLPKKKDDLSKLINRKQQVLFSVLTALLIKLNLKTLQAQ